MKKLVKHLSEWKDKGLISDDQQNKILRYEEEKIRPDRSKWILYSFLILGICVLATGLISLIAANWDTIPPSVKLTGNFLLLTFTAALTYRLYQKNNALLFEVLLSFFSLLCLASIGLISQIFHTGGELYQALLIWLIITFPPSLFSKKNFLPHLWSVAAILTYLGWAFSESSWWYTMDTYFEEDIILSILLALPFITFFISLIFKKKERLNIYSRIFNIWAAITALITVGATDFYYSDCHSNLFPKLLIPVYFFMILCIILLFVRPGISDKERSIILSMIIITMIIHIPNFIIAMIKIYEYGSFIGAAYSIVMLILFGMVFTITNHKKLFNMIIFLIGLRFLFIYFQVFGNLATTGIGLIFSGLLIIGISYLWHKKKESIEDWFGAISK